MRIDEAVAKYVPKEKQRLLLVLSSLAWIVDAAGVMVLSFTLPGLIDEWKLSTTMAGAIASSTFIGMLIGALSSGFVADLLGRKISNLVYLLSTITFTFLLGFARSPEFFMIFRILAGFGYGGLMPSVNAYLSEFTTYRIRGRYLVLLEASWAIGSIAIGIFSVLTRESLGWRWSFLSFFVAYALVPVFLSLPETPKYAYIKGGKKKLERVLGVEVKESVDVSRERYSVLSILKKKYLKRTVMIWISWFVVSFVYYALFTWAPKIFASQGISSARSLWFTFFMMVAQLPGYLSAAYFIEKIGRKRSLTIYFIGMGISTLFWGYVSSTFLLVTMALILSFFCLGVWGLVYAYTPELYPTPFRGTGNGSAGVMARIAGIIAPYYTGYMLKVGASLPHIFLWLSVMSILAGIMVMALGIETKGKYID